MTASTVQIKLQVIYGGETVDLSLSRPSDDSRTASRIADDLLAAVVASLRVSTTTLTVVHATTGPLESSLHELGLSWRRPHANHFQVLRNGSVYLQWWPSKGTTMIGSSERGPVCKTDDDFLVWVKSLQK